MTTLHDSLRAAIDAGDPADAQTIRAAIDRAAMLLGGGSAVIVWTALGYEREPDLATRAQWAAELLDLVLEAAP